MASDVTSRAIADAMSEKYRELTPAAVILGIIQGIILNLAFVYAALKLGFSIGGSTVAAISGYALLRGVMRKGTMIENNINQTAASSAASIISGGLVAPIPALTLLTGTELAWPALAVWVFAVSILGVVVAAGAAFALFQNGQHVAGLDGVAGRDLDLGEHARCRRRHLEHDLVGLEIEQVLVAFDAIALLLLPFTDRGFRDGFRQLGDLDFCRHACRS